LIRNVAGAFGIALFTTLLSSSIDNNLLALSVHSVVNVHTPAVLQQVVALMYLDAQILAYHNLFTIAAIILIVAALVALLIDVKKTGKGGEGKEVIVEI
jgi:hypothetical protein